MKWRQLGNPSWMLRIIEEKNEIQPKVISQNQDVTKLNCIKRDKDNQPVKNF